MSRVFRDLYAARANSVAVLAQALELALRRGHHHHVHAPLRPKLRRERRTLTGGFDQDHARAVPTDATPDRLAKFLVAGLLAPLIDQEIFFSVDGVSLDDAEAVRRPALLAGVDAKDCRQTRLDRGRHKQRKVLDLQPQTLVAAGILLIEGLEARLFSGPEALNTRRSNASGLSNSPFLRAQNVPSPRS